MKLFKKRWEAPKDRRLPENAELRLQIDSGEKEVVDMKQEHTDVQTRDTDRRILLIEAQVRAMRPGRN